MLTALVCSVNGIRKVHHYAHMVLDRLADRHYYNVHPARHTIPHRSHNSHTLGSRSRYRHSVPILAVGEAPSTPTNDQVFDLN